MNGDVITNINLNKLKSKLNSIAAIQLRTKFGIMKVSNDKVVSFGEKKIIPDLWMNAGIYHLSREIIKDLPKKGDIEKTTFPKYSKKGKLHNIKFEKYFGIQLIRTKTLRNAQKIFYQKSLKNIFQNNLD